MSKTILIFSSLVLILSLFQTSELKAQTNSTAQSLANIEAGYQVDSNHKFVKRFESLLEKLDPKYEENEEEIGNITINVHKILLKEKGIEESMIKIMEGMNLLFSGTASVNYAEAVSSYIVLRDNGYTHNKAVRSLKNIL